VHIGALFEADAQTERWCAFRRSDTPPLSVRATVRSRRWYVGQLEREVTMQTASLKRYLTEDFQEAARAFAEKRQPGPFKGR
jgi:enoyl-CoA hydratase/carnithine racemase